MPPLYFDTAATTFVDPEVLDAMVRVLRENDANAASTHVFGRRAAGLVDAARSAIADELRCRPHEILFTSGATESNNLALRGIARAHREHGRHIVTSAIEHRSVLAACRDLEREGFDVTYVSPTPGGWVAPEAVVAALRPDTLVVSLMHANNETGVIQPIEETAAALAQAGVLMHVDAAQSAGKLALDLARIPIDLLSLSAHKFCGPKGVGCLVVRNIRGLRLQPLMAGGGQEQGLRPGTLPNHQIVGLSRALQRAAATRSRDLAHVSALGQRLLDRLSERLPIRVHGERTRASPYILSFSIEGVPADALIARLSERLAIGSGSACASGTIEPSPVLRAMGVDGDALFGAVRLSFGRDHSYEDVEEAARRIIEAADGIRAIV